MSSGCVNFIDTSINFRYQKSERVVGAALAYLREYKQISRDELFISTKGGFIPEDADKGIDIQTFTKELLSKGIISESDIVESSCFAPGFLRHQITASRENMGINKIDCYSLNMPEILLSKYTTEQFYDYILVSQIEII